MKKSNDAYTYIMKIEIIIFKKLKQNGAQNRIIAVI